MFAIASIADCVGDSLSPFYSQIMPIIKHLYIHPPITQYTLTDPADLTAYRANALECITCVGAAVGGGLFKNDAREILDVMYHEGLGEVEQDGSNMKVYMMTVSDNNDNDNDNNNDNDNDNNNDNDEHEHDEHDEHDDWNKDKNTIDMNE